MKTLIAITLFFATTLYAQQASAQAWIARHAQSPADYQKNYTDFTAKGYRLTCVTGYTQDGAEKYVSVWEKKSGPDMAARHGLSGAQYQAAFTDFNNQGYRLTYVCGYGVGNAAKFAAIWEKKSGPPMAARHNLTAAQYQQAVTDFKKDGYRPVHLSVYMVGGTEYFAAIWEKTAGAWEARHNLTAAQYQQTFTDLTKQGYVLRIVSGYNKNGTDLYAAIWDKAASPYWASRHGIPSKNYQDHFDNMYYQGYKPDYINAFASGGDCKFNAIWTNTNMKGSDIEKIDSVANSYMKTQSVKGLSIAICKDGRLVFAKGYGYANPATGEELSPNNSMRIMSISKPVTSVGIMTLVMANKLTVDQKVFGPGSILGSKYPTPAGKQKLNNIRVRHLLWHTSGLRTCNGESVFWDAGKNADDAMNVLLNSSDLITTDTSGDYIYSNTNYFILARIIEKVSGQSYEDYIRTNVLNKCGIGNTMFVGLANGGQKTGEASYTPMTNMNMQLWGGFGGWVARPMDLLKFLNKVDGSKTIPDILDSTRHAAMTTGSVKNMGYAFGWGVSGNLQNHNGCHGSSRSFLVELPGGISYAVIINSTPTNDGCGWTMKAVMEAGLNKVSGYPAYDLF